MRTKFMLMVAILCVAAAPFANAQSTPPAPPAKAPAPRLVKPSDPPQMTKRAPPQYPESARARGIQGTVRLDTIIDTDDRVIETKYVSGPKELVQASMDCVKQLRFKPTLLNGDPVQVEYVFELNFNLGR
jgi:periplasmic protein TonB